MITLLSSLTARRRAGAQTEFHILPQPPSEYLWLYACKTSTSSRCYFFADIMNKVTQSLAGIGGSVGCAVRLETRRPRVQSPPRSATSFVESDHEIFSTVILSLPLIQEGQLSVSGERMYTILINRLED